MSMEASDYQQQAARTLIDAPDFTLTTEEIMVLWNAIGLAGETGEFCELVKKGVFHRKGIDRDKAIKELGDICWYLAACCSKLGLPLGDVMQANIDKLKARYPHGWDAERSHVAGECPVEEMQAQS